MTTISSREIPSGDGRRWLFVAKLNHESLGFFAGYGIARPADMFLCRVPRILGRNLWRRSSEVVRPRRIRGWLVRRRGRHGANFYSAGENKTRSRETRLSSRMQVVNNSFLVWQAIRLSSFVQQSTRVTRLLNDIVGHCWPTWLAEYDLHICHVWLNWRS